MTDKPSLSSRARRQFLRSSTLAAVSLAASACVTPAYTISSTLAARTRQLLVTGSAPARPPLTAPLRPHLGPEPTLETKIGQMLLLGFRGSQIDADSVIAKNLRDQYLGGVVLFAINMRSRQQIKDLTRQIQGLAQIPVLITTDQEGGKVARLGANNGYMASFSPAQLGKDNNLEETHTQAVNLAEMLCDAGITQNLAPVVDVAVNPRNPIIAALERSFSADPEVVAAQAGAFIDGHHEKGIKCTLKHFPGHGSSRSDTHLGFVNVTDTWGDGELIPYQKLIEQGKVDAIMTAHIFNAHLDADLPATLSAKVITGILRERLGYSGVVISDDMQMRAITDLFSLEKAFELAILAGVDMISVSTNLSAKGPIADRFIDTVHRLLDAGTLCEERIDQSYQRIMRLKGLAG
jgi:beta-N-acetylhexosaminidase